MAVCLRQMFGYGYSVLIDKQLFESEQRPNATVKRHLKTETNFHFHFDANGMDFYFSMYTRQTLSWKELLTPLGVSVSFFFA